MPPRTAHKREASTPGEPSGSAHSSKKTRFVEPSEDPVNFAEQVDSALETSSGRKGRVKNEGYESDSSDDGEGVVLSRRKEKEEAEDEDMFAIGEKEEKEESGGGKKKESFMRLGDIEGQEFGNSGSEDDESEDEPEDEDDAERRKKAGMGYELSSFNMREEMEEGKFTEDGTYVRSFDVHAVHDRWMDGLDEKQIKQARRQKKQQDRIQAEKMKAEERELEQIGGKPAMEKELLAMLKKGESVLEALQRLGLEAKKSGKNAKTKSTSDGTSNQAASDVERITHLASSLMSLGDTDVYSRTYEEFVRSVRSSGIVDESWVPPSADKSFEYRWDIAGGPSTEQVFGPYGEEEMQSWYKASYFGPTGEKVKVRLAGGEWKDWDELF